MKYLRIFISAGIICYLLYKLNLPGLFGTFKKINIQYLIYTFLLGFLAVFICTYRWRFLAVVQGINVSLRQMFYFYLVGMFFNNFMPSTVGGDVIKMYGLGRQQKNNVGAISSVFMDRFIGLGSLIIISLFVMLAGGSIVNIGKHVKVIILTFFSIFLLCLIIFFMPGVAKKLTFARKFLRWIKLEKKAVDLYNSIFVYRNHKITLMVSFFLSVLSQISIMGGTYLISCSLNLKLSFLYYFLLVPLIAIISTVPISLSGLGIREGLFVFFLMPLGVSKEEAFTISILYYFLFTLAIGLMGGILYAIKGLPKNEIKVRG